MRRSQKCSEGKGEGGGGGGGRGGRKGQFPLAVGN